MTISSESRVAGPFLGDGVAASFVFAFKVFAASDLQVVKNVAGVESTLTLTTDYSVALNADQNATPGGTVTLTAGALAVGQKVAISTAVQYTQGTDLTNQGGFYPAVVTAALDKLTILAQQVLARVNRALVLAATDTGISPALPAAALRVGKFLGFDAGGNPAMLSGTGNDAALRTDLAASGGSALAGHLAAGAGSVARTVQAKLRERVTPEDKGAARDGVTNDYAALVNAIATSSTVQLTGGMYQIGTSLNFGSDSVFGTKGSTIKGKGITFDTGADFYDSKASHLLLDGTGSGGAENGLKLSKGHRVLLESVVAQKYLQGFWLTNSYISTLFNSRSALNSYGGLIEENSNAVLVSACSFTNNTNTGLTIRGSYSVTSFSCDYEANTVGLIFGNLTLSGAEPRNNRSIADYFEGNSDRDVWIGDQGPSAERCRYTVCAFNYHQADSPIGYVVDKSDRARLLWNQFATAPANTKYFLRANSAETTLIPFPQGTSSIANTEVTVEAGATVSHQTIQYDVTSITADGAGAGFVDIAFKAPYASVPPIHLQFYSTTDRLTAAPTLLLNNVTVSGVRVRVVGAGAGEVVKFSWRAGA